MSFKVNIHRPSFGVVTRSAINLAKSRCERDIDKLVASQEDNVVYNVSTTAQNQKTTLRSFCVSKSGRIIKRCQSFVEACMCASSLENDIINSEDN